MGAPECSWTGIPAAAFGAWANHDRTMVHAETVVIQGLETPAADVRAPENVVVRLLGLGGLGLGRNPHASDAAKVPSRFPAALLGPMKVGLHTHDDLASGGPLRAERRPRQHFGIGLPQRHGDGLGFVAGGFPLGAPVIGLQRLGLGLA